MGQSLLDGFLSISESVKSEDAMMPRDEFEELVDSLCDKKRSASEEVLTEEQINKSVEFFAMITKEQFIDFVTRLRSQYPDFDDWLRVGNHTAVLSSWSKVVRGRGTTSLSLSKFARTLPQIICSDRNFAWSNLLAYIVEHTSPSSEYYKSAKGDFGPALAKVASAVF